jgi:hypothetical protein
MTRGEIKTAIKDQVDDSTINDSILNEWIQAADDRVQIWRPPQDQDQTFDWWDYLKDEKTYATQNGISKYAQPDNFRAFIGKEPLSIQDDNQPYTLIDYRDRDKYSDHVIWMLGKYFYIKAAPSVDGKTMTLGFVRFSDPFATDNDEPEIEPPYHQAYVAFGKSRYYNQQGDTELENQNLAEFERIMTNKWRDQELAKMQSAGETASIQKQFII